MANHAFTFVCLGVVCVWVEDCVWQEKGLERGHLFGEGKEGCCVETESVAWY
jgi:hypothetical protein